MTLTVEGVIVDQGYATVFSNHTTVHYEAKYVSIFINLDQPIYYAEQTGEYTPSLCFVGCFLI